MPRTMISQGQVSATRLTFETMNQQIIDILLKPPSVSYDPEGTALQKIEEWSNAGKLSEDEKTLLLDLVNGE